MKDKDYHKLLDIGCGSGLSGSVLTDHGYNWIGVDISSSMLEVAKENEVKEIYYIDIWDDEGTEILRDKYEIIDGKLTKTLEGTKEYYKLLDAFDSVLRDYTLTDSNDNIVEVGEKRIYAPNFFFIKDGKVVRMISGKSDKQTDSREELTEEMLADEEEQFNELFLEICDDAC